MRRLNMDQPRQSLPLPHPRKDLKIIMVHNAYQQRGGEDAVVRAEASLLEANGQAVVPYERHNDELRDRGALGRLEAGIETVWSSRSFREMRELIRREKPDVVHFHNTFPLISPSAYYACAQSGVPVVQTLHNFRLACPAAKFLRDGRVCEACLGRVVAWPGAVHGCYRGSRAASATVATMLAVHQALRTWQKKVDVYIALSEFTRQKFIESGLPADRVVVKPNFVAGDLAPKTQPGDYVLFVGRLSEEKGPQLLLSAWNGMKARIPLHIAGDGPLLDSLSREIRRSSFSQIELIGHRTSDAIRALMQGARFLIFPSVWYEGFPMTIAEAFANGLPVIASQLGSMVEIVQDGVTGLHFEPGNAVDLAAKVEWAWAHPEELSRMGCAARAEYEAKYQPSTNYEMLMDIYRAAIARHAQRSVAPTAPLVPPGH
jgi:glycosyltransferase involved in cell wall biosynthesis